MSYRVDIGIPITEETFDQVFDLCDKIEKALGRGRESSGCGFGYRDMQFEFDLKEEATDARTTITKILTENGIEIGDYFDKAYISIPELDKEMSEEDKQKLINKIHDQVEKLIEDEANRRS